MSLIKNKRRIVLKACELLHADQWWKSVDDWRGLVTLNYHRFGDASRTQIDPRVFSASAEQFEAQLRYLKQNCDVIGLADVADVIRQGSTRRAVLLTIDDGYLDNYEVAYPILKQQGIPALIFLTTGFLDEPKVAWWDEINWIVRQAQGREFCLPPCWRLEPFSVPVENYAGAVSRLLRLAKALTAEELTRLLDDLAEQSQVGRAPVTPDTAPWMTWDMVREMRSNGIDFGGHTVTHPVLSYCSIDRQRAEISGCKSRIEQELGETITAFSYPIGTQTAFTDQTMRIVQESGYHLAFGFYSGYSSFPASPYDLRRVAIHPGIGNAEFRMTVSIPRLFAR